jgi:hypothetical protein
MMLLLRIVVMLKMKEKGGVWRRRGGEEKFTKTMWRVCWVINHHHHQVNHLLRLVLVKI